MFDFFDLPNSPSWARKLKKWTDVNKIVLDREILELSLKDLVPDKIYDNLSLVLDIPTKRSVQYILDWNTRCVVLDDSTNRASLAALISIYLCNIQKPLFIITSFNNQHFWNKIVKIMWPDFKISILDSDKYDKESDVFITTSNNFFRYGGISEFTPNYVIIDEFKEEKIKIPQLHLVLPLYKEIPNLIHITQILYDVNNLNDLDYKLKYRIKPIFNGLFYSKESYINQIFMENKILKGTNYEKISLLHFYSFLGVCPEILLEKGENILFRSKSEIQLRDILKK